MTGAATAKARFASSVRVHGKMRCGASEEHTAREVTWISSMSARYGGFEVFSLCSTIAALGHMTYLMPPLNHTSIVTRVQQPPCSCHYLV